MFLIQKYKVCTKSYLAKGKDGYQVFAKAKVLVSLICNSSPKFTSLFIFFTKICQTIKTIEGCGPMVIESESSNTVNH